MGRLRFGLVGVGFGFAMALGACAVSEPVRLGTTTGAGGTTGAAGDTVSGAGGDVSMATGAAGRAGMATGGTSATCAGPGAVPPPPPPRMGVLQLPSTIAYSEKVLPPLTGGTLLALSDGTTVVASDPDRDQVYIVDLATNTVRATVALQAGDEPGRLVEDGAGRVHVALRRGGAVVAIDPVAGTILGRRIVCSAPRGIVYQASTKQLHVACAGGELVSLPPEGGASTRQLTLDRDLRDVVVGANGSLLVTTFRSADVLVVSPTGTVTSRLRPGSGAMVSITTGMPQMRTPSVAWRIVPLRAESGQVMMLHQTGVVDPIDPSGAGYAGLKGCDAVVETGVSILDQGQVSPPAVAAGLSMVALAVDVAVSPDGTMMAVAAPGNSMSPGFPTLVTGSVSSMMTQSGSCNFGLNGVSLPPTGQPQIVAVAYTGSGLLLAQSREPAAIWRQDTQSMISLASDSRTDTGHLIFHANAGGGLACASCHPEGGEDGRVWNFACTGARRTQSIRGGISGTAPFHWDGSETDFSRLMDDVFSTRMAGPVLSSDQKVALQRWVDSIPALPRASATDPGSSAAVSRGQTLFNDPQLACATCHTGTLLTNNMTVDVGTGGPLQVPSLRGVAWRAPFMHTGCAATLAERFAGACGGGDKHGVTSTLTSSQMGDLTAYLETL